MCIPLTPVQHITNFRIEVYLHCVIDSGSQRELGIPTSRAEISSSNSIPFKAVERAQLAPALKLKTTEDHTALKKVPI